MHRPTNLPDRKIQQHIRQSPADHPKYPSRQPPAHNPGKNVAAVGSSTLPGTTPPQAPRELKTVNR